MMNKRKNLITLSAALCGLAVVFMAPAAHGHGNNPKRPYTGNTDPKDPQTPPGGSDAVDWPWGGGDDAHLGAGPSFGGSGGEVVDIPREVIIRGTTVIGLPDIDAGDDVSIGIGPADVLPKTRFGGSTVQSVPRSAPAGGVIPTPGTLGLLGVATLILRRRRRR
jgi:MYXO-CTERM domain-containing protein